MIGSESARPGTSSDARHFEGEEAHPDRETLTFEAETLTFGKRMRPLPKGGIIRNAGYEILQVSPGLKGKDDYYPNNMLAVDLKADHIDPEFQERGALLLRSVPDGLLITRLRFLPEGSEGSKTSRKFLLARSILLSDARRASDLVPELLYWCVDLFRADPVFDDSPTEVKRLAIRQEAFRESETDEMVDAMSDIYADLTIQCLNSLTREDDGLRDIVLRLPETPDLGEVKPGERAQWAESIVLSSMAIASRLPGDSNGRPGAWPIRAAISVGLHPDAGVADLVFTSQRSHYDKALKDERSARLLNDLRKTHAEKRIRKTRKLEATEDAPTDPQGRIIGRQPIKLKIGKTPDDEQD